jgi:sterol carrier protein 2
MAAKASAYILGVGMTAFTKPGSQTDYHDLAFEAGVKALLDAHISFDQVDRGVACYCYGDSTCGQRAFYQFGMTQIPIYNVNNNCATGSTGMVMARDFVSSGLADCVLVLGFEKMAPGSLSSNFNDREDPLSRATKMMRTHNSSSKAPFAAQMFGNAAQEYIKRYGATAEDFAEVARVNHEHSTRNPYSQFQKTYTLDQVLQSAAIHAPLTKLQCCPTSDGAAAAVVVSKKFLDSRIELKDQAIQIIGQCLATDSPALYDGSAINLVGFEMAKYAAGNAFAEAGISIEDVKVIELHDCFSTNEILVIDALGLTPPGKGHEYVRSGKNTYGTDAAVMNPSGGLISKGHPLGATGIAQCTELVWQLRGWANNRLVLVGKGQVALQQNAGLGGAAVVSILKRADGLENEALASESVAIRTKLGYNPAVELRRVTAEEIRRVLSGRRSDWAYDRGVFQSTTKL